MLGCVLHKIIQAFHTFIDLKNHRMSLNLGTHAQLGFQYLVAYACVCVCVRVCVCVCHMHIFSDVIGLHFEK